MAYTNTSNLNAPVMKIFLCLLVGYILSGCTTSYNAPIARRNFTGQDYPTRFATIITEDAGQCRPIFITHIDEVPTMLNAPAPTVVDVASGKRKIRVSTASNEKPGTFSADIDIHCNDHNMYRVSLELVNNISSNNCFLNDSRLITPFQSPIEINGNSYSNINCLLLYWNILPVTKDVPTWLANNNNRNLFVYAVDSYIQQLSYSNAKQVLTAIDQFTKKSSGMKYDQDTKVRIFNFCVYNSFSELPIVQKTASFTPMSTNIPISQNFQVYIPPYTPIPATYKPPAPILPPPAYRPAPVSSPGLQRVNFN